jgi:Phytanoyl-CoA dioxygenase (PhyH)
MIQQRYRSRLMHVALDEFGFQVIEGVFTSSECHQLPDELGSPNMVTSRAGARHLLARSDITSLANGDRLRTLASSVLGDGTAPFRATYFNKTARANWSVMWHQDTALPLRSRFDAEGWGPWSRKAGVLYAHAPTVALQQIVAIRVHLDDSCSDNGPLRVIPGSHRLGVLSDDEVSGVARTHASAECLVPRGGVLIMRPLLIHASSKMRAAWKPRRVLHIEYASSLHLAPHVELAAA